MKKITSILLAAMLALVMNSCADMQAKRQISKLESLVERVEQKGSQFTDQQWKDVSDRYEDICEDMEKYHYTDIQMQEIGRLKARYYAARVKNSGGLLNGFFQQLGGFVDGILDEAEQTVDDAMDEAD